MKYLVLTLLTFGIALSGYGTDIKKSVCVVRPDDVAVDSLYARLGLVLQRNGYISAGRVMSSRSKSFGSGFVFQSESGGKYVVTNRHVVGLSKKVQLEFQVNNESKIYYGCDVLYSDIKHDVAIIALPSEAEVVALKSEKKQLKDGQEVYTAGFPGLGGSPLWQLGKGIVSNAEVNTGKLGDRDSLLVIQHTAQVDAGNSGGPLLVQHVVSGDTVFFVAGINTWKANWRENTNFSTRVAELEDFIAVYEQNASTAKNEKFSDVATNFAKDMSNGYKGIVDYFSSKILLDMSDDKLVSLLKIADEYISSTIRSGDPEYGIKMLIAKDVCDKLKDVTNITLQSADDYGNGTARSVYTENKSNISFRWQSFEDGWRIVKTDAINLDKSRMYVGYQDIGLRRKIRGMVGTTVYVPIHESQGAGLMFHCLFVMGSYFMAGVDLGMQGSRFMTIKGQFDSKCSYGFSWHINAGFQLPLRVNKVAISPYAIAGFGCDFLDKKLPYSYGDDKEIAFAGVVKAGIRLGYVFDNGNQVYLAPEYRWKTRSDVYYEEEFFGHYVGLRLGFEWNKTIYK